MKTSAFLQCLLSIIITVPSILQAKAQLDLPPDQNMDDFDQEDDPVQGAIQKTAAFSTNRWAVVTNPRMLTHTGHMEDTFPSKKTNNYILPQTRNHHSKPNNVKKHKTAANKFSLFTSQYESAISAVNNKKPNNSMVDEQSTSSNDIHSGEEINRDRLKDWVQALHPMNTHHRLHRLQQQNQQHTLASLRNNGSHKKSSLRQGLRGAT